MPRYLVTLRHAETGETRTVRISGLSTKTAMINAEDFVHGDSDDETVQDFQWRAEYACPADDEPVPGRDR